MYMHLFEACCHICQLSVCVIEVEECRQEFPLLEVAVSQQQMTQDLTLQPGNIQQQMTQYHTLQTGNTNNR